jgi:hypothetical protein
MIRWWDLWGPEDFVREDRDIRLPDIEATTQGGVQINHGQRELKPPPKSFLESRFQGGARETIHTCPTEKRL